MTDAVLLLARLLMTGMFAMSAYDKFQLVPQEVAAIRKLHLPVPKALERLTGVCEAIACLMLIVGPGTRIAAVLLAIFTLSVSFAFLRFWSPAMPAAEVGSQRNTFLANVSMVGGLLYVAVFGPGAYVLLDFY